MADIVRIDLTDVQDTLQGTFQTPFRLTSMADDSNFVLQAGWTEEIGGYLYRVDGGNITPGFAGSSGNTYYLYITEDGDGTATATLSPVAPTYNATKGGYYNGNSKAVFSAFLDGSTWIYKTRVGYLQGDRHLGDLNVNDLTVGNDLTVDNELTVGKDISASSITTTGQASFSGGASLGDSGRVTKIISGNIGAWWVSSGVDKTTAHGISSIFSKKVVCVSAVLNNDPDDEYFDISSPSTGSGAGGLSIDSTNITFHNPGGLTGSDWDSTTVNRGYWKIEWWEIKTI